MTPELKQRWVEALRSDSYQQAQKTLHDQDLRGFCCLGVLCDTVNPEGWTGPQRDWWYYAAGDEEGTSFADLCDLHQHLLGLSQAHIEILIEMNDNERRSFPQIADWIEKNL